MGCLSPPFLPPRARPIVSEAMKGMKAMKAQKSGLTTTAMQQSVADTCGVKRKDVKSVLEAFLDLGSSELKKTGTFKIGQMIKLKLKVKPATPARKGVNPFTKEPCVFKAKPASKTVKALALKKLKAAVN